MVLKAVLFDFNGVIINDERIHQSLIEQLLIEENLRPLSGEYRRICLGRSDRTCLRDLFTGRGRVVTEGMLDQLMARKAAAYLQRLSTLEKLPIYPGLSDLIFQLRAAKLTMAVVSGALRSEVELVLQRAKLASYFTLIVAGDDIPNSKPDPSGYLLAVERLAAAIPQLDLQAGECLAIEDTPAGMQAAKAAGMQVVGVANTLPLHMIQRQSNWAVDYLNDLELERIQHIYARMMPQNPD
ncbi:HAD family hydrolase [Neosynechococcus sphagnicola sy1]|uniref:HAD family hydrolase n=1 Tax=Neosynechococcus sphagnicola sy1 TaxID=1497020 RepID=A0A098TPT6_9CYAN|nr:HAD family phosphatase [Neosynechococcus sphagnicola]KGF72843.1 HAD family hydrolase [Neosynechococcus sphagnicola sy1]